MQSKGLSRVFFNTTVQQIDSSALSLLYSPTLTSTQATQASTDPRKTQALLCAHLHSAPGSLELRHGPAPMEGHPSDLGEGATVSGIPSARSPDAHPQGQGWGMPPQGPLQAYGGRVQPGGEATGMVPWGQGETQKWCQAHWGDTGPSLTKRVTQAGSWTSESGLQGDAHWPAGSREDYRSRCAKTLLPQPPRP